MKTQKKKKIAKLKHNKKFERILNAILYFAGIFLRYFNDIILSYSVTFHQFIRIHKCMLQLNRIFNAIHHNENADRILPSTINAYQKDIQIKPFWNLQISKISKKIFLPTNANMEKTSMVSKILDKSWFDSYALTFIENSHRLLQISIKKFEKTLHKRSKSIKLFLNSDQKCVLKKFIGIYRYFYNMAVDYINNYSKICRNTLIYNDPHDKNHSGIIIKFPAVCETINEDGTIDLSDYNPLSFYSMRDQIKKYLPKWLDKQFPRSLIDQAIHEAQLAYSNNIAKYKKTKIPFDLKYKSRKDVTQNLRIESLSVSQVKNSFFANYKVNDKYVFENIRSSEPFFQYGRHDINLKWNRVTNEWIIYVPINVHSKNLNQRYTIAAVDPGVRHFSTTFSENHVVVIGTDVTNKLYKVCKEIDIIKSKMDNHYYYEKNEMNIRTLTSKRKKQLRIALHRKIKYLKNLKNELHYKTIKFLCNTYKIIIFPKFETQKMSGVLNNKIARSLYNLSFYQFRMRLIEKAEIYGVTVFVCNEAYTTMTCTSCGELNYNVGDSKIFNCPKCGYTIGRDINGARNCFLRNIIYI